MKSWRNYKNGFCIVIDILLMISGVAIAALGIIKWKEIGFIFEPIYSTSKLDGRACAGIFIFGIALLGYGFYDFTLRYRRSTK